MCGRKNYRLQSIQLIEITGASAFGLRASSVARGAPKAPLRSLTSGCRNLVLYRLRRIRVTRFLAGHHRRLPASLGFRAPGEPRGLNGLAVILFGELGVLGGPASLRALNALAVIKVENTGLEPVTSWLQTRRSPS